MTGAEDSPAGPVAPAMLEPRAQPNIARIYDFLLGGKDNYAVDRQVAERLKRAQPLVVTGVRANRAFVRRAVAFLAESGVDQFVDVGSGLPTGENVHAVAARVNPDVRVAYVDNDPTVLAHARALLVDPGTIVVEGDIRRPKRILADRHLREHIDVDRPVAVICAAILHFVSDEEDPARIVGTFREAMVPGSALVISHVVGNGGDAVDAATREGAQIYSRTTAPFTIRTREEVAGLFAGFRLVRPGLVDADTWRRNGTRKSTAPIVAGVGILDGRGTTGAAAFGGGSGSSSPRIDVGPPPG